MYILVRKNIANYTWNEKTDMYHGSDVNIAIASAITAGGRMWMSSMKNNSDFNLFYSDTDSVIIDQPLNPDFVGDGLGRFKLEHKINRAVFLAPKVYGFTTFDGQEVIKVKGVVKEVVEKLHVNDLEKLLVRDSNVEFNQKKWFKQIFTGDISVIDVAYNLSITSNKREAVYHDDVFVDTKPYYYSDLDQYNSVNAEHSLAAEQHSIP